MFTAKISKKAIKNYANTLKVRTISVKVLKTFWKSNQFWYPTKTWKNKSNIKSVRGSDNNLLCLCVLSVLDAAHLPDQESFPKKEKAAQKLKSSA